MRTALAAAVTVLALVTGLVVLAAVGPDPTPPSTAPSGAATNTPTGTGAEASTAPTPAPISEGPGTLVMWSRGDLSPQVAERAAALPHVTAAAFIRSDTLGLVASRTADGATAAELTDGWRIPVDVAAVDPHPYAATLDDPGAQEAVRGLEPGQVLLPEASATLRGVGVGGRIDLVGLPDLQVAAVVPDGTVRRAEIVLHVGDANAAGIELDGSVILRHRTADRAALEAALRRLAPADQAVRIVDATQGGTRYRAPLVLSLVEVKARFGEFAFRPRPGSRDIDIEQTWVDEHITSASVPILGTVRCHRGIVEDLRVALTAIVDAGLAGTIDPADYAGCFHPRLISAGRGRLSHHSWGIALDINVDLSQPGLGPPPPPEVVEAFGQHGFRWGGDFLHADNHHFEWLGPEAARRPD